MYRKLHDCIRNNWDTGTHPIQLLRLVTTRHIRARCRSVSLVGISFVVVAVFFSINFPIGGFFSTYFPSHFSFQFLPFSCFLLLQRNEIQIFHSSCSYCRLRARAERPLLRYCELSRVWLHHRWMHSAVRHRTNSTKWTCILFEDQFFKYIIGNSIAQRISRW